MKFISLDVSTKSTGLAVFNNNKLESYKLITANSTNLVDRIQKITKEIQETIGIFTSLCYKNVGTSNANIAADGI